MTARRGREKMRRAEGRSLDGPRVRRAHALRVARAALEREACRSDCAEISKELLVLALVLGAPVMARHN